MSQNNYTRKIFYPFLIKPLKLLINSPYVPVCNTQNILNYDETLNLERANAVLMFTNVLSF